MLRITKLTDYAVVVLASMVGTIDRDDVLAARDVAEKTGIPQPTVSKVLKQLARAGLVTSARGKHGGYRLARQPKQISVAEIINAVEGPIALTECSTEATSTCELEGSCPMEANWVRINVAIRRALEEITLAEMSRPMASTLVRLRKLDDIAEA
jgi:FeS assembly SUF system regulator